MEYKNLFEIGKDMLAIIGALTIVILTLIGIMFIFEISSEKDMDNNEPSDSIESDRYYSDSFHATDKDCSDFSSAHAAQVFFEEAGSGDPHDLDRDGDGYACEWNG